MRASGERILIVDDQESNVRLLSRILEKAGYADIASTTRPEEAVSLLIASRPGILLLDLHMPGMDGFAVLELLRPLLAGEVFLPVLVLTADSSQAVRERALASGANDFLVKPFDPTEVVLRIVNLLETRGLHLRLRQENDRLEERVRERTRALEEAQAEILERLARAAELHDDDTGIHTRRVGELAGVIAAALGLSHGSVDLIRRAAPLHDVGKIGIPDAILRKPGGLTAEEREVMERHAEVGARILGGGTCEALRLAEEIAHAHHERWDGGGYPRRLSAEAIPLAARIVAVADVFDALSHDRPYRRALAPDTVLAVMRAGAGSHFDPRVVDALLACGRAVVPRGSRRSAPPVSAPALPQP